ncbi:MAG TPA: LuxR C-terminal-related transcriptional regulator [Steroidobacteraceae bacterium]
MIRLADFEQHTLRLAAAVVPASRFCVYRVGRDLQPYGHVVLGGDTRWIEPYMREYRAVDPFHPRYFEHSPRSVFRMADAQCAQEQLERYRAGFQSRMGMTFKAEVFLRGTSGHILAGLRISRSVALGEFGPDTVATLEALEPVLTAALHTALRDEALSIAGTSLTAREREVLRWVAEGVPNKLICARLGLALPTVKCHVKKVLHKFGAHTRAELLAGLYRTPLS